jgi:hypothetical protein
MNPRSGMTILEVLFTCTVSAIMLGLFASFLIPAMRAAGRGTVRSSLQQEMLASLARLTSDLDRTTLAGISQTPPPTGGGLPTSTCLGIQRVEDLTSDGTSIWETRLVVYVWSPEQASLERLECDPATAGLTLQNSQPVPLSEVSLRKLALAPTGRTRLAAEVRDFAVTLPPLPPSGQLAALTLRMKISRRTYTEKDIEWLELSRVVCLRNP